MLGCVGCWQRPQGLPLLTIAKLADDSAISYDTIKEIEKFTGSIYGAKENCQSLNVHRFQVVYKSFGPKKDANPFDKLKGVDGSCLPPCEAELLPHIQRAAFVARMWANAHEPYINQSHCQSDGRDFINGEYNMIMFKDEQLPDKLLEDKNLTEDEDEDNSNGELNDESNDSSSDSDSNSEKD